MKKLTKAIILSSTLTLIQAPGALSAAAAESEGDPAYSRAVDMMRWQERIFKNSTTYRSVMLDGERVLRGEADGSASALYQNHDINLRRTPYIHWRWRIDNTLDLDLNEREKEGDDYVARLYVVRNGGLAFWRTKAIIYVWSNNQPVGTTWENPYAGPEVRMWAVDSGSEHVGQWREHVRDIRADWLTAFGEEIDSLDGLALMTDTDNSGLFARAWYADIRFSSQP